jgi:hypothetical protein
MMGLAEKIGADLRGFGGLLRCTVCGREEPLGDVGTNLATGWPKCHDYTMRWVTAKQLEEETLNEHSTTGGRDG